MGSYIGIDGKARKIKTIYIGVNGKACKIKNTYIGDSNGKARLVYRGIIPYGSAMYATPGKYTFTVPSGVTSVTATIVGGGGSGMGMGAHIEGRGPVDPSSGAFSSGSSAGGSSSFGSYTSTGGGYNYPAVLNQFIAGMNIIKGQQKTVKGGNPGGHDGNNTNAGSGFAVNNKTYGIGGVHNSPSKTMGACGGSGGYQKTTVAVTPGNNYSVVVGAGGKQCSANGVTGYAGGNGCVFIEWGTK